MFNRKSKHTTELDLSREARAKSAGKTLIFSRTKAPPRDDAAGQGGGVGLPFAARGDRGGRIG
jgi:hypothetical protein